MSRHLTFRDVPDDERAELLYEAVEKLLEANQLRIGTYQRQSKNVDGEFHTYYEITDLTHPASPQKTTTNS